MELHCCPIPKLAQAAYEEVYGERFISNPKDAKQKKERRKQLYRCEVALDRERAAAAREREALLEGSRL